MSVRNALVVLLCLALTQFIMYGQTSHAIVLTNPPTACDGDCGPSASWTVVTKTIHVSKSGSKNYAKPLDVYDDCTVTLQYKVRTCSGNPSDGPHTDIYLTSFCSTCPGSIQDILKKFVLRSHFNDDPLSIISATDEIQYFRWIIPSCWSIVSCSEELTCAAACVCLNPPYTSANACQGCCAFSTKRTANDGCDIEVRLNFTNSSFATMDNCGMTLRPSGIPSSVAGGECLTLGAPCEPICFTMSSIDFPPIPR